VDLHNDPTNDPVLDRIGEALAAFNAGRRADARDQFNAIWAQIGADGNPFHQCILAHYLADAQDDPEAELVWDRRALKAAESIARTSAGLEQPDLAVLSLFPSLHLNLADVLQRTGNTAEAREQLARAQATVGALGDDGYGQMIRAGIERLAKRLG
jgi:hypothetical protein